MFSFVSPDSASFPSTDVSQSMDSDGNLMGMQPYVSLPSLEGFNTLLSNINDRFYYEGSSYPRPQFSGIWVPFVYRIQSLNLNPFGLVQGGHKYAFLWPTASAPDHRIQLGCMSTYELLTLKKIEVFKQLGISNALTELHTSRNMQSLMTPGKFPDAGQIDFSFTLQGKFTNALELMGAGEKMYVASRRVWDLTYGVDTDTKIGVQRRDFHIATIAVAYNDAVLDWYDQNARNVGKLCPSLTQDDYHKILTGMALVMHPTMRASIEAIHPNLYTDMGGDPLKITLFLLGTNQPLPGISLVGSNAATIDTFARLCGFSTHQQAQDIILRFGFASINDIQRLDCTSPELELWWKDRDDLNSFVASGGVVPASFQDILDVFQEPMKL